VSFIESYKAYGLNQDSKDIKIKDHTLDLKVVRIEQHILEVTIVKEETQELLKYNFDLSIIKEETQLKQVEEQKSIVQVRRFAIDLIYKHNFKKFQYYCWVQSSIVLGYYNVRNHKKSWFLQA
jgi:adenine-specific DNA glycosylase